jgi:16S rRNA (guanine1516-N2)-methyltransferase
MDPMFPIRKKSAQVKKEMQALHQVVGGDEDAAELLEKAFNKAKYRVVIKRPMHSDYLGMLKPSYSLEGKSTRYDIFAKQKIPK